MKEISEKNNESVISFQDTPLNNTSTDEEVSLKDNIVYSIYPPLGVARVGNGPPNKDDVVFQPNKPWSNLFESGNPNKYITEDGLVRKMAQRFTVGYTTSNGHEFNNFDPDKYNIRWTVEVANKKPFWYYFNNCLDLSVQTNNHNNISKAFSDDEIAPAVSANRRNPNVTDGENGTNNYRKELVNSPGPISVDNLNGRTKIDIMGMFPYSLGEEDHVVKLLKTKPRQVKLGTIECDTDGSLIFYAGDGVSSSLVASDLNTDFADNSNWYDDICDGRVTATLLPKSKSDSTIVIDQPDQASWIVTTPPDYAPQIQPLISMADLMVGCNENPVGKAINFFQIFSIFYKLYRMQWVNIGDFLAPSFKHEIDKIIEETGNLNFLYDNREVNRDFRTKLVELFRNPTYDYSNEPIIPTKNETSIDETKLGKDPLLYPSYPGDGVDYPGSPAQWFAIPPYFYTYLELYKDGKFSLPSTFGTPSSMDEIAKYYSRYFDGISDSLTSIQYSGWAVYETLYGGGFHPGVEITWPFRHKEIYKQTGILEIHDFSPMPIIRINAATSQEQAAIFYKDFGQQINAQDVQDSLVPGSDKSWLWKITPGDLTKWMGIPWQSDAASCQLVYTESEYPIPAWWAANLPVSVLTSDSYEKLKDRSITKATRKNIFANRQTWLHTVDSGYVGYHAEGGYTNGLISMVNKWKDIGIVTGQPSPASELDGVPETVYVAYQAKDFKQK